MPYMLPRRQTFQEDVLPGLAKDLLLMAITQGASIPFQAMGKVAQHSVQQTGNVQNLPLSGGRMFSGTPGAAERLIPNELAGMQQSINRGGMIPSNLPQGFSAIPTGQSAWGRVPDYERELARQKVESYPAELAKLKEETRGASAKADINERAARGELQFMPVGDGTFIPVIPTTSGGRPVPQKDRSVRDQVWEDETGTPGTASATSVTTFDSLPDPKSMREGQRIRDSVTGKRYVIKAGQWVALTE